MTTYSIKTPQVKREYKRRDFAARQFMIDVYNALAAGAQLDTKTGHEIYNACEVMARDVESGAYSEFSYSRVLPHGAGLIEFEGSK